MSAAAQQLFEEPAASALQLRPLQAATLAKVREAWIGGAKNVLVQAPCGFGKTEIATAMLMATRDNERRGMFVCDRLSLLDQTSERFDRYGLDHGVIQGSHWRARPWHKMQLCSVQTLTSRGHWPETDLLIVDEAHVLHGAVKRKLARRDCRAIGLTATPFAKGLGRYFDALVNAATTTQLIEAGWLTPYRIFAASAPDMEGVAVTRKGDWDDAETEQRVLPIVGDCVSEYVRLGEGRKFIVFAVSVAHAEELQRQFMSAGLVTELYTYQQGDAHREATIAEFRKPRSYIRGLISIEALTRGFDVADVGVLILARPLRNSLAVHIQMLGRVLRTAEGKDDALILDHAGNCVRFWADMQAYMDEGWHELDDGKPKENAKAEKKEREPMKCPRCAHVHDARPMCPMCGHEYPKRSAIEHRPGTLSELTGFEAGSSDDRQSFYSQLLQYADARGWSEGAAAHKYRERYKTWPTGLTKAREPVSRKTADWVKSQMIAWSKRKRQ